ncbi:MAG: DUF1926 domain-containing protein [Rhodocyclaceae bacterium]
MPPPITLLFGVHAHQPVGNFPAVIDDALVRCYRPFLHALHRFPDFRFSVHISGWLLEDLCNRFPDDMALLAGMVRRGQVEMVGGGDCEPVLSAIPGRDRLSQIRAMSERLKRRFDCTPQGAWLTERAWEATVVPALADSGIRYTVVDDYHFLCTGLAAGALDAHYTTEEDGRVLDVFPISEALRYRIPFSLAEDAVAHLERLAAEGHAAAIYFDDIEKFGIWPETWEWVYQKGWLERFIRGVLASPRVRTGTYSEFRASHATRGVIYLPTTSYVEMNEWTLPPAAASHYARLVRQEKEAGSYASSKPHLRGGFWRNFLSRYPEANWMHKRMLELSQRLAAFPDPGALRDLLHRAQANDAYWHGLFGGLYLPHLRRAVWRSLIELEEALDARQPRAPLDRRDLDLDGHEELMLHNAHIGLAIRLDGAASLHELDGYALRHNFCDTVARRHEFYHRKFNEAPAAHAGTGIASAHDRMQFRHAIGADDLLTDPTARTSLGDCWHPEGQPIQPLRGYVLEAGSAPMHALEFSCAAGRGRVRKHIALEGNRVVVSWRLEGLPRGRFVTRLNLAMPSCDGYSGRYILEDGSIPCGFGQPLALASCARVALDDLELGGAIELRAAPAAQMHAAPYHTVSLSEAGFEKIMQAACLTLTWELPAGAGEVRLALELRSG